MLEAPSREILGVEVKASVSLQEKDFAGLRHLKKLAGERFRAGVVLYVGKQSLPMGEKLWAMPISTIWSV